MELQDHIDRLVKQSTTLTDLTSNIARFVQEHPEILTPNQIVFLAVYSGYNFALNQAEEIVVQRGG